MLHSTIRICIKTRSLRLANNFARLENAAFLRPDKKATRFISTIPQSGAGNKCAFSGFCEAGRKRPSVWAVPFPVPQSALLVFDSSFPPSLINTWARGSEASPHLQTLSSQPSLFHVMNPHYPNPHYPNVDQRHPDYFSHRSMNQHSLLPEDADVKPFAYATTSMMGSSSNLYSTSDMDARTRNARAQARQVVYALYWHKDLD